MYKKAKLFIFKSFNPNQILFFKPHQFFLNPRPSLAFLPLPPPLPFSISISLSLLFSLSLSLSNP